MKLSILNTSFAALTMLCLSACTEPELEDDFELGAAPKIGDYNTSADVASTNLVAYFPFEGTSADVKNAVMGAKTVGNPTYVAGRKGKAYKGADGAFLSYDNPGPLASLTSYTTSMWINTQKHTDGAESVFVVAKDDKSFWGNFFMLIEGNSSSNNKMHIKMHFEKNSPAVPNVEHWVDLPENMRPDNMYGGWKHVAFTYDAGTSKHAWYINGQKWNIGDREDRKSGVGTAGLGALAFKDATKFVIAGFQQHLGGNFGGTDVWMKNYRGALDEFRIYNKALAAQEINALFKLEIQGR